jgi:hypothetical protein
MPKLCTLFDTVDPVLPAQACQKTLKGASDLPLLLALTRHRRRWLFRVSLVRLGFYCCDVDFRAGSESYFVSLFILKRIFNPNLLVKRIRSPGFTSGECLFGRKN